MQRIAVTTLLVLNVTIVAWLVVVAKIEPPDWKEPMHAASDALNKLTPKSFEGEIYINSAKGHFETADFYAETVIAEFRRESKALWILIGLNSVGFAALLLLMKPKQNEK